MKKNLVYIAVAALLLPILVRGLWFYHGIAIRPRIATPDYASFNEPKAPVKPTPSTAEDIKQYGGVVLFDTVHGNQFTMTEIESLSNAIKQRGAQIELLSDTSSLESKLKYASAFVVISPSVMFTTDETHIIENYVDRGGRLMVFTDATRNAVYYDSSSGNPITYSDVNTANPLLAPFDISINNDYLYNLQKNEGNFRNVLFDQFGKSELTFGLKEVALYGTHSVESQSGLLLLRGTESNLSSGNDAHNSAQGGAALSKDGNVLVFGDFTFMSQPYSTYTDNSTLIGNLADFALSGKQTITLANFPYVFSGKIVQVFPTSEIQITPEIISALSGLQSSLQNLNIKMEIVDKAPSEGDAIILGTFTPSDDLTPFTDLFRMTIDSDKNTVNLADLGNLNMEGNGLILFERNKKNSNLTLLSDTQDDLTSLINTISSGYLSGCVLQNNVGVCGVGYSSGDFGTSTDSGSEIDGGLPTDSATPTPVAVGQYSTP